MNTSAPASAPARVWRSLGASANSRFSLFRSVAAQVDHAFAVNQQQVFLSCAQVERQPHRGHARGAGAKADDTHVLDFLVLSSSALSRPAQSTMAVPC